MATAVTAARVRRGHWTPKAYAWATLTPVLILVGLFTVFPFAYAAVTSVRRVLLTLADRPFVGLRNYEQVIANDTFQIAFKNTLVFTVIAVPLVTAIGLAVAVLLNQRLKGFGVLLALVILPWSIPLVSAGIIWRLLLHGNFGAVNGALLEVGAIDSYVSFLSRSTETAMASVLLAHVWREFPLPAILFLAGLQAIPPDVMDAATADGATAWQRFRRVTLPLLKAPLLIVLVYETMIALAMFDLVYVLTGGGPGTGTTLFAWFTYTSTFRFLNFGHGAALSFMMAAVLLVSILFYLRLVRPEEAQEDGR